MRLVVALFYVAAVVAEHVRIDSLPISARVKLDGLEGSLVDRDRARFEVLFKRGDKKRAQSVALKNTAVHYTLTVGIGSPRTDYELLVDTGSAYTWLGAAKKYVRTRTSFKQPQTFYAVYGSGSAVGDHYKDLVTLSPSLSITNKSFGVASSTNGMDGSYDGILGLGPTGLGKNVVTPSGGKLVPTVMDALVAQKKITANVFGVSFMPTTTRGNANGEITLGGTNSARYTGKLNWVPITTKEPWNQYWGFEQSVKVGTIQGTSAGVVDTGTTLIYITPKAFKAYSDALPGSKIDNATKLLEIPKESVGKMQSLFFAINGVSYEFTPNAQLWPRALNTALGGKADAYYSVISALTDFEADTGSNFINGYVFLQRFYSAYDASKSRIGFATTSSTYAIVN
ncbi:hypothetical protein CTheo_5264 [Ceratobasidium theobromae]|uniref:Peptidase A1 domain-containing protein n=1 Tax=Ceratobasidium theobromae TaxID=1582974 RepID=A0A5N5QHT9_9AGAM|nr:hypothetical protein CTheo_5264 [Ceratobasidium theobromae]